MKRSCFNHIYLMVLLAGGLGCGGDPRTGLKDGSVANPREPLPNWATPEELKQAQNNPLNLVDIMKQRTPPSIGLRVPAEYEPTAIVAMTWTSYQSFLQKIAVSASAAGASVWMVGGPSSIDGVANDLYRSLDVPYNSVWMRDYGPVGIDEVNHSLGIIDTIYRHHAYRRNDDLMPQKLAAVLDVKAYGAPLILDGGNFMTDGQGNLFTTVRTYEWNSQLARSTVDKTLKEYFGMHTIHWFAYAGSAGSPEDGTGHIDMFAKLLAPCKVLVADSQDKAFQKPLNDAASYFASLSCGADGKQYQVFRIKAYVRNGTWYTYTNSLIVNKSVIIPSYAGGYDKEAREVYEKALPDYKVDLIPSDSPITAGGSIHCTTKEIPAIPGA